MTEDEYLDKVGNSPDAFLAYFTLLKDEVDINDIEYPFFNKLARSMKGLIQLIVVRMDMNKPKWI